jgi:prolyl oligopeptidase
MEDQEDTIVKNWMIANSDYARAVLDGITGRQGLIDKMKEFDERRSDQVTDLTILDNDRYFYLKTTPEDEAGKLFTRDGFGGEERMLFDPQLYGEDSVDYVIGIISPSLEGDKVAFTVEPDGSENTTTLILKVGSGEYYPEKLRLSVGGVSWLADGEHFLYTKINSEDVHDPMRYINNRAFMHRVGTSQDGDRLFFSGEKYPQMGIKPMETPFAFYDHYADHIFLGFLSVERYLTLFVAEGKDAFSDRVNCLSIQRREPPASGC